MNTNLDKKLWSRELSGFPGFLIAVKSASAMALLRFAIACLFLAVGVAAAPVFPSEQANKLLPATLGNYRAAESEALSPAFESKLQNFNVISAASRIYRAKIGGPVSLTIAQTVTIALTRSDSSAYSLLTNSGCKVSGLFWTLHGLEAQSCVSGSDVYFAKGSVFVHVTNLTQDVEPASEPARKLAEQLAETLDKGTGDIPALVRHLPGWEAGNLQSSYAVTSATLKNNIPNQPIFDAVSFEAGVEAASAAYGNSQLVIVEFNTPQIATENDGRIATKLQELRSQGQPVPTAYRRVGNYAVFVFNAPDETAANQLIDQVKYQQVVTWLGHNPFSYEQATREFTETTLGVLVAVVKTSGLALLATIAVGGFLGALLFHIRRSQQRAREAYADSDAMLRLNLDDLTPERDPQRLLGRGN
jgi:hypothetical protein